jgi:hypothetical protein
VCCSSAPECAEIGFDDITPCEDLRVCVNSMCVNPQCTTSAECSAPTPYCVGQICAATCTADPDCTGAAGGPICAPDGACVECLDSTACTDPADGVCDDTTHACRPCTDDSECGSGICLATAGTCAAASDVVFVSMAGTDGGACTDTAPCLTIPYALTQLTPTRRVLRIASADYIAPDGIALGQDVYVDAAGARVSRTTVGPVIDVSNSATVIVEGVRILGASNSVHVGVGTLTLMNAEIGSGTVATTGRLTILASNLSTKASCQNSYLTVDRSQLFGVSASSCVVDVRHSDFDLDEGTAVSVTNGTLTLENNVIVTHDHDGTGIRLDNAGASSVVRYNTLVAPVSKLITASIALSCTGGSSPIVTSNIIAWRSTGPVEVGSTCELRNTLFDLEATGLPPGSPQQDIDAIFVDTTAGDYRPATASMARAMSEPGLDIVDDHDGTARPQPVGTAPDSGAYEVP